MRKLKFLLAVLLITTIVLLSGCANIQSLFTENDRDFYEISAYSDFADTYYSVDISGDNILFLTAYGIEDYVLSVYNVEKNSISAKKSMTDCPLDEITGAIFEASDQIVVYDENNEKAVTYDLSLNETGTLDYPNVNYYEAAPETDLLKGPFCYEADYAYAYIEDACYFVFYDKLDKIYVTDLDNAYIHSADGNKLFMVETKYSKSGDSEIEDTAIYVKDIRNGLCVNSLDLETPPAGLYRDVVISAVSDEYVCFVERVYNDITGAGLNTPYVWKYSETPQNDTVEVRSMTEEDILADSEKLINEIRSNYGINVFVNEKPEFGYEVELNAAPLQVNHILTQLADCLELFPENFFNEIYQYTDGVKGLNIHIVENIDGAGAFANDFLENYEICFSCSSFGRSIVFHEFMHLIDNRIESYYEENNMDFRDVWRELNPEDFEYGSEIDYGFDENHFVSSYAMTNVDEDLADTFQAMFEAYENRGDIRFTEYEYVGKKAALICEAIRNAFPSMSNADKVCWEKYADFDQ